MQSLAAAQRSFELSDTEFDRWAYVANDLRIALVAAVMAWLYPVAGHVLRSGTFDMIGTWRAMRGNRLRLIATSILLTAALIGLDRLVQPLTTRIAHSLDDPLRWTLEAASIRYLVDFPFSVLWTVAWAVMVGFVLDVLKENEPTDGQSRPVDSSDSPVTAAAAPLPRSGGSRPS